MRSIRSAKVGDVEFFFYWHECELIEGVVWIAFGKALGFLRNDMQNLDICIEFMSIILENQVNNIKFILFIKTKKNNILRPV